MHLKVYVHARVWKELPRSEHERVRAAVLALAANRAASSRADLRPMRSFYKDTFRLRVGRVRILLLVLPEEKALYVTTAFVKKRATDYETAMRRHEARVRSHEDGDEL